MDDPITAIARLLAVSPETIIALIPILIMIFNFIGRWIPDNAEGFLGIIRKITKVLGLYLSNRIATGITVNEMAVEVCADLPDVKQTANEALALAQNQAPAPKESKGRTKLTGGKKT